jgi:hypothetical protein
VTQVPGGAIGGTEVPTGIEEIYAVSRAIATAVAPGGVLTPVQAPLLGALTKALTDVEVDYAALEPISADELSTALVGHSELYRQRIVQHMVLGELVLHPVPRDVAARVTEYATALGIDDDYVRLARRYAEGALGVAWVELRRDGFLAHWDENDQVPLHTKAASADPWEYAPADAELAARWNAFADLELGTLGRSVWEMYRARGFRAPGTEGEVSAYLAQHDFVHVLADYGTTMAGELEVFAFCGRADPEPKGFAWLATMIGLFETGHVHEQGFFKMDVHEHPLEQPGMALRLAHAIQRGKQTSEVLGRDLFAIDYHELAAVSVEEVRDHLAIPPKGEDAKLAGSSGAFDPDGMSEVLRALGLARAGAGS